MNLRRRSCDLAPHKEKCSRQKVRSLTVHPFNLTKSSAELSKETAHHTTQKYCGPLWIRTHELPSIWSLLIKVVQNVASAIVPESAVLGLLLDEPTVVEFFLVSRNLFLHPPAPSTPCLCSFRSSNLTSFTTRKNIVISRINKRTLQGTGKYPASISRVKVRTTTLRLKTETALPCARRGSPPSATSAEVECPRSASPCAAVFR